MLKFFEYGYGNAQIGKWSRGFQFARKLSCELQPGTTTPIKVNIKTHGFVISMEVDTKGKMSDPSF